MKTTSDETFQELREAARTIWKTYDDQFGYASEKIARLDALKNVSDNYGTIIGMFDGPNQTKLYAAVGPEAQLLILDWTGAW